MNKEELKILINFALEWSKLSKCAAKKVCCILYKDNNIIGLGLNGSNPGAINCNEIYKRDLITNEMEFINEKTKKIAKGKNHHEYSLINEYHSELNAIRKATEQGFSIKDSIVILTHAPCYNCAKLLACFGVKTIYYVNDYDDTKEVKEFLDICNIPLIKVQR